MSARGTRPNLLGIGFPLLRRKTGDGSECCFFPTHPEGQGGKVWVFDYWKVPPRETIRRMEWYRSLEIPKDGGLGRVG
jgi:hypothetical protein